jgi:hypothetical protein
MQPGRPVAIAGLSVEKMPNGLYRINQGAELLALWQIEQKYPQIHQIQMNVEKVPDTPIYPDYLRAMTTHFPWAWLMAHGYKEEEYRTRKLTFPPVVLLHSGLSTESDWVMEEYDIPRRSIQRGAILGAARVIDCVEVNMDGVAGWAYQLADSVVFENPVAPVSGKQPIFWRPQNVVEVRAFNLAWRKWELATGM